VAALDVTKYAMFLLQLGKPMFKFSAIVFTFLDFCLFKQRGTVMAVPEMLVVQVQSFVQLSPDFHNQRCTMLMLAVSSC
jgi:hypothetical protein